MKDKKIPVAIQLYSLRDVVAADVAGALKKVAAMGYDGVELAGYYDLSGKELKRLIDGAGLACAGAHTGIDSLEGDEFSKTVEINKAIGNDLMIIPWADMKDLPRTIDRMLKIHEKAKACGMQTGFHNHTQEFAVENGVTMFDRIFSAMPEDFAAQLDIGWATCAGQDVKAILRKYAKRLRSVHIKEHKADTKKAVVGEGSVNWLEIFDVLEKETSVQWYVVEQEQYEVGPFESAKGCIDNIRGMGR